MSNETRLKDETAKPPILLPEGIGKFEDANLDAAASSFSAHSFVIGEIGLLLPPSLVCEVASELPICRLPQVPGWFWGMVNLRGNLLPVFDLRELFELGQSDLQKYQLLAVHIGADTVGIVIDNLPVRVSLMKSNLILDDSSLPRLLQAQAISCYEKDNSIWVEWDIEGFFSSLSDQW